MKTTQIERVPEVLQISGLDWVVKYAALFSWFIYAAGMTRLSGFLRTLGVPTEPSFYALSTVFSIGGYTLFEILKLVAIAVIVLKTNEKVDFGWFGRFVGWAIPFIWFIEQNYWLVGATGTLEARIYYPLYFLVVAYVLIYLFVGTKIPETSIKTQVLIAAALFYLVAEGSGFRGDLEAWDAMNTPPSVQFLLSPDATAGANKMGIPISSEPGVTTPLNVVAFSEKDYYVQVPYTLDANSTQQGIQLNLLEHVTIKIPRDKVLMASNANRKQ